MTAKVLSFRCVIFMTFVSFSFFFFFCTTTIVSYRIFYRKMVRDSQTVSRPLEKEKVKLPKNAEINVARADSYWSALYDRNVLFYINPKPCDTRAHTNSHFLHLNVKIFILGITVWENPSLNIFPHTVVCSCVSVPIFFFFVLLRLHFLWSRYVYMHGWIGLCFFMQFLWQITSRIFIFYFFVFAGVIYATRNKQRSRKKWRKL